MKIVRFIAAVALLTTVAIISVSAQQPKPGATAPTAAPQANVAVPDSKLALIYSDAFLDPKAGIARFATLLNTLNREFQPRQTELSTLGQKIDQLTKEINDTQAVADPKTIQTKGSSSNSSKLSTNEKARTVRLHMSDGVKRSSRHCRKISVRLSRFMRRHAALLSL